MDASSPYRPSLQQQRRLPLSRWALPAAILAVVTVVVFGAVVVLHFVSHKREVGDVNAAANQKALDRLSGEHAQIAAAERASETRRTAELAADSSARAATAAAGEETYEAAAAKASRDDLVKRQNLLNAANELLNNASGAASDAAQQVRDLLGDIDKVKNCPSYLCNARASGTSEAAYLIERWSNNTATSFVGSLPTFTTSVATGGAIGVDQSPYELDFNAGRERVVGRCNGPLSAAGAPRPFIYTVQQTLYGSLVVHVSLNILVQIFDVAMASGGEAKVGLTASAWSRAPDGSFRRRSNVVVSAAMPEASVLPAHPAATAPPSRGASVVTLRSISAPFAATYVITDASFTVQNSDSGANPNAVVLDAGDVLRIDLVGMSAFVLVAGETYISTLGFSPAPGGDDPNARAPVAPTECAAAAARAHADAAESDDDAPPAPPTATPGATETATP